MVYNGNEWNEGGSGWQWGEELELIEAGYNGYAKRRWTNWRYWLRGANIFVVFWILTLGALAAVLVPVTLRMMAERARSSAPMAQAAMHAAPEAFSEPVLARALAGGIEVRTDPRVELMSILFRLAGNPEYGQGRVESYARDVERRFGLLRGHEAVLYARALRNTQGISFEAPMSLAFHLESAPALQEAASLTEPLPPTLDPRWTPDSAARFHSLAEGFAAQARFAHFLNEHRRLYDTAVVRLAELLRKEAHLAWFDDFFGPQTGNSFTVVPACLIGEASYGALVRRADGDSLYCVLGVRATDDEGMPVFDRDVVPLIIHEFAHSYVGPLVEAQAEELRPAGEKLLDQGRELLRRQGYDTWHATVNETLVRAAVVRYLLSYGDLYAARKAVEKDRAVGFPWTNEVAGLLEQYEGSRDAHPTFESFMPRVAEFLNHLAETAEPDALPTA